MKTIEQKQLQTRWNRSESTVRRRLRRYDVKPVSYVGRLLFAEQDIVTVEAQVHRDAMICHTRRIEQMRMAK